MIKKQIEVLNTGYKHTGLSFTLAGTNRVENRHGSGKLILECELLSEPIHREC